MLLSPERYKETYLLGKDADGVKREIDALRRGIANLKHKIESPSFVLDETGRAGYEAELSAAREYLSAAKAALYELCAESYESEEESAARFINERLSSVRAVDLTIGVYLTMRHTLTIAGDEAVLRVSELHGDNVEVRMESERVIEAISALCLGEWRDAYLPEQYGCFMSEPERWHVRIEFSDGGAPLFYDGVGVYPYNFKAFCHVMGVER